MRNGFPIGLTSPLTTGKVVREAQRALADNEYGDFKPGTIDGQFGEETARAVRRAKYWLGYEEDRITSQYGLALHAFLVGTAELDRGQTKRRAERKRKFAQTPLRQKALNLAESFIGVTEMPAGSNRQKFGEWYRMNGVPWCAIFVTYCYVFSGSRAFVQGRRYAYCPYVVNDARSGRNNLAVTRDPQPGDLVLFDWAGDGVADHIGLFKAWRDQGRFFASVEANTSPTNNSNGGAVMLRERSVHDITLFAHVGA